MTCVFCGAKINTQPVRLPATFTAYQFMQAGSGVCEDCREKLTDAKYRRNSWVIKNGYFKTLEEPLETLLNPPEPPFLIYLTKTKRKHGWILAVNYPVLNRNRFMVTVDEERLFIDRQQLSSLHRYYEDLRKRGLPKHALLKADPSVTQVKRAKLSWRDLNNLKRLKGNKLWELVVKFGK